MDFWKYVLMQEDTNSILCQRRQNGWNKKSVHTLKLLSKRMQQIRKCHAFQVYVVVENVKTLNAGWFLRIYVCVRGPLLLCGFIPRSVRGFWSCLCMTHMKQNPWDATDIFLNMGLTIREANDTLCWPREATRTSPLGEQDAEEGMWA